MKVRHRRSEKTRNQVTMKSKLHPNARVAIIGGGLSGLICAQECHKLGLLPHVFDTGERLLVERVGRDQCLGVEINERRRVSV